MGRGGRSGAFLSWRRADGFCGGGLRVSGRRDSAFGHRREGSFNLLKEIGEAPRLDALAVHCYAWSASACIQFTQVYEGWASSWGVPEVWVSEFSISPSAPNTLSQSLQEAQTYINWLEADSMITRFAWFASKLQGTEAWLPPTFITPLTDWNTGQLTTFGTMYLPFR